MKILLNDYEIYHQREEELMELIEEKLSEVPYIDKLLEIKGIGMKTVSGFVAEVGDIKRFDNPKQLQKLAGYAIVECSSGKVISVIEEENALDMYCMKQPYH